MLSSKGCRYNIQDIIEEMEVGNEAIGDLYKIYFQEIKENIQDISQLIQKEQWKDAERIIHNIKGVSVNLNICDVYDEAVVLQEKLINRERETIDVHIRNLIEFSKSAEAEVKTFFLEKGVYL